MSQPRKTTSERRHRAGRAAHGPEAHAPEGARPLSARSVIASTLLGMDPPRLPVKLLVRSGEVFGISEGTTRTAVSRMVAAGELEPDGDGYRLAGRLLARQARQQASRQPPRGRWDGRWTMAVVVADRRSSTERAEARDAFRQLHLAELREGVWLRPDNLPADRSPDARAVVDAQCQWFTVTAPDGAAELAARLWDLDGWAREAASLRDQLRVVLPRLEAGDLAALAPGFVLSAAVLRHLLADPLLPPPLLPAGWPGQGLRADYDVYDRTFKAAWRDWFRGQLG